MPTFRNLKKTLRELLTDESWADRTAELDALPPASLISPLIACLPLGEPVTTRAAKLLGHHVARLASEPDGNEQVRNLIRRLMWHMNEDSGNIGWGIPEAFGEILAARRDIASTYCRVLISYVIDTGHADNFCEHPPLRRSCYRAILRLIEAWPDLPDVSGLGALTRRALHDGIEKDQDAECRKLAAAGLEMLHDLRSKA